MRMLRLRPLLILLLLPSLGPAQGRRADYERAAGLRARLEAVPLPGLEPRLRWGPRDRWITWVRETPDGRRTWMRQDLPVQGTPQPTPAFDHPRLAVALGRALRRDLDPERLPLRDAVGAPQGMEIWVEGDHLFHWEASVGRLERREPDDEHPWRLPRARGRRSRDDGGRGQLLVVNATAEEVELLWLDRGGRPRPMGRVPARGRREISTFNGHLFTVRAPNGPQRGAYRARRGPSILVVPQAPPTDRTPARRSPPASPAPGASPDGRHVAHVHPDRIELQARGSKRRRVLARVEAKGGTFRGPVRWAADSRHFFVPRVRDPAGAELHLLESSPPDRLLSRPRQIRYPRAGDERPHTELWIGDVRRGRVRPVEDRQLFPTPYALSRFRWHARKPRLRFLYNERGHQVVRLLEVDARELKVRQLVEERSASFVCYSQKGWYGVLDASDEILWMSERDGWNHLWLLDAGSGRVKRQLTRGEWPVWSVEKVDEGAREILLWAGGGLPGGQSPYHRHLARVSLDGGEPVLLTAGDGTHSVSWSPSGRYLQDRFSRVDAAPVTVVRDARSGAEVARLGPADLQPLARAGWSRPERFHAPGRDGRTPIWGVIYRPSNFDPKKRYPVIEQIYAGPHGHHVPQAFRRFHGPQRMAELGFILVQIDGMGTNHRSKAFHDVCWRNLQDSGFPDRIAWMQAAARTRPWMDLERVGIYGGSAGGQSALRALIDHHGFYDAAAADCGCHDNRIDKSWWNEQWMGWPVGPHYEAASNIVHAHRMRGALLLTVGELDRNVDPASTLRVVDALIRANKDFDFLMIPGAGHGAGESPYARRRRDDFFVRHLWGREPRAE
jgi:dipeptidyl-peptidase-4